jgi:hypothetical protein
VVPMVTEVDLTNVKDLQPVSNEIPFLSLGEWND